MVCPVTVATGLLVAAGGELLVSCVSAGVLGEGDDEVLGDVLEEVLDELLGGEDVLVEGDTGVVDVVLGEFVEDVVRTDVCSVEELDDVGDIVEVVTG